MRVISVAILRTFWEEHEDAEQALRSWFREAQLATWTHPLDIKAEYASASFVGDNRVVFNIKGKYRLVVAVHYNRGIVYIRFVGTHKKYDSIDVATV
jgi:mRNA interferase HigB